MRFGCLVSQWYDASQYSRTESNTEKIDSPWVSGNEHGASDVSVYWNRITRATMTTAERAGASLPQISNPDIFGAIISFGMIGVLTFVALILSFKVQKTSPPTEEEWEVEAS